MVQSKKGTLPLLISLILVLVVFFIGNFSYTPGWDFRNNLWAPAHLLLNGQNPYNIGELFDASNAIWLPMAIVTFLPVGFLPLQQASNLWWMINLVGLIALVWISSGTNRPPKMLLTVSLFIALLFPPTISHFDLGQITILVCLAFTLLSIYGKNLHPFWAALLVAFSLSKPQLTVLVLPGYFYAYLKTHGGSQTFRLIVNLVLAVGILTLPFFILSPQWFDGYLQNFNSNPNWAHPSSLHLLRSNLNQTGVVLWALLFLVGSGINLSIWHRLPKKEAMLWSLALTPLFTLYIWSWDFVFLLPLLIHSLFKNSARLATGVLYFATISTWVLMITMKMTGLMADNHFWWVPWYMIAFVLISRRIDARRVSYSST